MITETDLNSLCQINIESCIPSELIDIRDVQIDRTKSVPQRMQDYFTAVRNPYLFKVDDVVVKISFNPKGKKFSDAIASVLRTR